MEVGTAMHWGIERWIAARLANPQPDENELAQIIVSSVEGFKEQMADHPYETDIDRGAAQVEALIALFVHHPNGWEKMNREYEILHIEPQIRLQVSDELVFNARPDIVARERSTGLVYTIDLKSAAQVDERNLRSMANDFQGILQPWATQEWLEEPVVGEIRWNMVKGKKAAQVSAEGEFQGWVNNSYLTRPYVKFVGGDVVCSYGEYESCSEPHKWRSAKGGVCEGGKRHKRSDDWKREEIGRLGLISEWVERVCVELREFPESANAADIAGLVVVSEPLVHTAKKRRNIVRQLIYGEQRYSMVGKEFAAITNFDQREDILNMIFPQDESACEFPYRCRFHEICHGTEGLEEAAIQSGLSGLGMGYEARQPNHWEGGEE